MNYLVNMICRIGIFMICAQTIIHFRPDRSYEKYLKLLAGMMAIVQIFMTAAGYIGRNRAEQFEDRVRWFSEKMSEGADSGKKTEMRTRDSILEEVERVQEELYEEMEEDREGNPEYAGAKIPNVDDIEIGTIEIKVRPESMERDNGDERN